MLNNNPLDQLNGISDIYHGFVFASMEETVYCVIDLVDRNLIAKHKK